MVYKKRHTFCLLVALLLHTVRTSLKIEMTLDCSRNQGSFLLAFRLYHLFLSSLSLVYLLLFPGTSQTLINFFFLYGESNLFFTALYWQKANGFGLLNKGVFFLCFYWSIWTNCSGFFTPIAPISDSSVFYLFSSHTRTSISTRYTAVVSLLSVQTDWSLRAFCESPKFSCPLDCTSSFSSPILYHKKSIFAIGNL